jgi:hypothetical protein
MPIISTTNADGSISTVYEDAPAPVERAQPTDGVEIDGKLVSRAEIESVMSANIRPLPEIDNVYQPPPRPISIQMGGTPLTVQRDSLTRKANHWLERAAAESAGYDDQTGAFIPRDLNDRDSVQRLRVACLNLRQIRNEMEYLSGQSQQAHAAPAEQLKLSAHDQAMVKLAEESNSYVWDKDR